MIQEFRREYVPVYAKVRGGRGFVTSFLASSRAEEETFKDYDVEGCDENAKYAVLIDGAWGSGKTYLYENYLVDAIDSIEVGKNERKRNVYISLYGISNIDSLAKQLITNYLIYVKGNGNKFVKSGLKPLAGIIGVASSAFSFSLGSVSTDLSGVFEKIENNIDIKNMVICFDDLERCTIPINTFWAL